MRHAAFSSRDPLPPPVPPADPIRADIGPAGLRFSPAALARALEQLPHDAPVIAMIHGWRYGPGLGADCPHDTILSLSPRYGNPRVISWPRALSLDGQSGLGIGLGWQARCGLWAAHSRARLAGEALAGLAGLIREIAPGRRLHLIGHSMGARVALCAVKAAPAGSIGRVILLAGAETRKLAAAALASPAGEQAEIVNVTSRENALFDAGFEWAMHLGLHSSIGRGLPKRRAGWSDLRIDRPESRAALARLGFPLAAPESRIDHWSAYLRPGLFPLYRALIDGSLPVAALPPEAPARRFGRLLRQDGKGGGRSDFGSGGSLSTP